jgi:hypothetical protein
MQVLGAAEAIHRCEKAYCYIFTFPQCHISNYVETRMAGHSVLSFLKWLSGEMVQMTLVNGAAGHEF